MIRLSILCSSILCFLTTYSYSKPTESPLDHYQPHTLKSDNNQAFHYRTAPPVSIENGQKYPLLIFFHGAGGRGEDNTRQLTDAGGIEAFEKQGVRLKRKSHIFAGQVPKGERWVNTGWSLLGHRMPPISDSMKMAFQAIDAYTTDPKNQVDLNRIYAMGLSMGGYGTWDAIQRRPDFFAAAVPICGGGDKKLAKNMAHLPIWAWHGEKDTVIKPIRSSDMIDAIKKAGGSPKYSEIKGRGHNSWIDVWNSNDLWDWLFSQSR
jgi:predicted peptidase